MVDRSIDKRPQYVAFATHCPQLTKVASDRQSRTVLRDMAAEWLKLAEAAGESDGGF
jgi:predicted RNase H-like HicB family nuclease